MRSLIPVAVITVLAILIVAVILISLRPERPSIETTQLGAPLASPEPVAPTPEPTQVLPSLASPIPKPTARPAVAGYVIDMSGQPIPGVVVSASGAVSCATSDPKGYFAFGAIEGVTTTLRIDQHPYLPVTLVGLDLPTEDAVFVLCTGGRISGRVIGLLSRPARGVKVEISASGGRRRKYTPVVKRAAASAPEDAPWRSILARLDEESIASVCRLDRMTHQTTLTGSDGRYVFESVPAGEYTVRVKHESLAAPPRDEIVLDWEESIDGIDFKLGRGSYIHGRAYEEKSGAPVAGVTVSHYVTGSEAVTGQDGVYDLGPLSPGHYSLRVNTPPNYVVADLPLGRTGPEVNVTDRDIEGVDIKLERAGLISGRVVGESGEPVEGARVSLALGKFNPMDVQRIGRLGKLVRGERTDRNGRFRLKGVPQGNGYVLHAGSAGYAPGRFGPFDLGYGETKEGIEIVLLRGGEVFGRVLDRNGDPVPGYSVVCLPGESFFGTLLLLENEPLRKSAETLGDGTYRIENVSTGRNVVMVYSRAKPRPGSMPKAQRVVDVTSTTEVDFTVDVTRLDGVISGRVTTSKGLPAREMLVMALCKNMGLAGQEGFQSQAVTGEDGTYVLEDLLPNTAYTVIVSDAKGSSGPGDLFADALSRTVTTSARDVDFVFEGRGGISGRVVYRLSGRPVSIFNVVATRVSEGENPLGALAAMVQGMFGGGRGKDFSSTDGSFLLEDLLVGTYNLKVTGEGFATTSYEGVVVVEDQTTSDVVIEVEGGGAVEGVVRDSRGRPIEGALVSVQPSGAPAMLALMGMNWPATQKVQVTTGADGEFSITGLDEGHLTLRASHEGYAAQTVGPIAVPAQGVESVQVTLSKGGRIEGHAYDKDGNPVPGARLSIVALDGSSTIPVTADSDGFYQKENVPEGEYIVGYSFMDIIGSQHQGAMHGIGKVRNGETTVVDVGGPGGTTVVGTVHRAGRPAAGLQILFVRGSEAAIFLPGGMISRVTTDSAGTYRATGLPSGPIKLLVVRMSEILQGRPPQILHRRELELPETGEVEVDINLRLSSLSGSVRDAETGDPVEGALLMLLPDLAGAEHNPYELRRGSEGGMGAQQAVTDSGGAYRFAEVEPQKYILTCRAEGYGQQSIEISVEIEPVANADFALPKDVGEIVGRIIDTATGRAVPGAVVFLIDSHGQMVMPAGEGPIGMFADQGGRFGIDSVAAGAYALVCGDPIRGQYAWSREEGVVVLAGQPTQIEVELERGTTVVLSLVDPAGEPLMGAEWTLLNARGVSLAGQVMEIGNVLRTVLPPGEYTARAQLAGFQPATLNFVIQEGQASFQAPIVAKPM